MEFQAVFYSISKTGECADIQTRQTFLVTNIEIKMNMTSIIFLTVIQRLSDFWSWMFKDRGNPAFVIRADDVIKLNSCL